MKVSLSFFGAFITLILVSLFCVWIFILALKLEHGLDVMVTCVSTLLLSLIISFIFRKTKIYSRSILVLSIIACSFGIIGAFKKNKLVNDVKPIIEWTNTNHKQTLPFFVAETGHLYLKTIFNSEEKYLLFDTGMDITSLHEKYNNSEAIDSLNVKSSQAIKQDVAIHKLYSLSFGDLNLKNIGYGAMSKETWSDCGIFPNQDSIAGILGNNVINNFVWDLDMVNREVTIQDKSFIDNSISNKKIIPLIRSNMGWKVNIQLNGKKKKVKFDSGNASILNITDGIQLAKTYTYPITNAGRSKGVFSYLNCEGKEVKIDSSDIKYQQKRSVFVNLKVGDTAYKDAYVIDKSASNLLGIPLFWEYERVVLDFLSKKIYLINPVNKINDYQISTKSKNTLMSVKVEAISKTGYYDVYKKEEIKLITKNKTTLNDTIEYYFKGKMRIYASLNLIEKRINIDSIIGKGYTLNLKTDESINHERLILHKESKVLNLSDLEKHL
ncbi:hypothetical protein FPF71_02480 [Algibacter amylolyticus]|uniref:Peptidase A2 domain-containing protein n=1 Tax=Algibacter amylolyticus TaxID=1608400 RepID=A0A5M7BFI0_9FLAO|nr:hypothetical protein [Algibacter amylolyticus]KAA5827723.1 hypothetical protein F2B50_02480 [Algibacter amylolyticus]MBB5266945.1 hypothetical protein [Algibacter amylolyticus]TSJ81968.1 hypothetical protein FPF71_02480 [Algibacter amylolyticus]